METRGSPGWELHWSKGDAQIERKHAWCMWIVVSITGESRSLRLLQYPRDGASQAQLCVQSVL
jgi:hypothetical protein